ncbi:MAG: DUF1150 family protein [Rhodospirillales bacterium]|nr:DUF1150 family protein [Rhodospirillales bacterium]
MNHETQKNQATKTIKAPGASPPMSAKDFAEWGSGNVAYIRPLDLNGKTIYAMFSANGQQLGLAESLDLAHAAVIQNDLQPVNVH